MREIEKLISGCEELIEKLIKLETLTIIDRIEVAREVVSIINILKGIDARIPEET